MRPPRFWAGPGDSVPSRLLAPLGAAWGRATTRRATGPGWQAPVPVICCGNVTMGGAGKTILALDLADRLRAAGCHVHVLLRGYGGSSRGPRRVTAEDDSALVGDEALLLAAVAPTWIGADRAASALQAVAAGAEVLLLDDGLQNPTLAKDLGLLVIDGGFGFGNGRVFPAGPLREPVRAAAARCHAAVLIGPDRHGAAAALPSSLPVLTARLVPGPAMVALAGREVLAFAGIGRPEKFFISLREAGAHLADAVPFADHHRFRRGEIERLLDRADRLGATAVTTAKDAVRLPPALRARVTVATVVLVWEDEAAVENVLPIEAKVRPPAPAAGGAPRARAGPRTHP